jgi:hypothetical protein
MASTYTAKEQRLKELVAMMKANVDRFNDEAGAHIQLANEFEEFMNDEQLDGGERCGCAYEAKEERAMAASLLRRAKDMQTFAEMLSYGQ